MREGIFERITPEQPQEDAQYLQWMKDHPEAAIAPENLRECEPEIAEFEKMLEAFEIDHPLVELHEIVKLTPAEAPRNTVRESARLALIPIVAKMNALKKETNIPLEKYDELKERYKILSRAVGMINDNKVDHTR